MHVLTTQLFMTNLFFILNNVIIKIDQIEYVLLRENSANYSDNITYIVLINKDFTLAC